MNANDILVIGIGQAGNNLAEELCKKNKRITGICFNSSSDDMAGLSETKTFPLAGTGGAGRNREQAKIFLKDQAPLIVDTMKDYNMKKHVFIAFSMGGGTGSGITPILLNLLYKMHPDKQYNIIPILPFTKESKGMQENTVECWKELKQLFDKNIGAIYLLNNNKRKTKQAINREFADLFNIYLSSTNAHVDGVIDRRELEILGTTKGLTAIYDIKRYVDEPEKIITEVMNDSIFVLNSSVIENVGLSIPQGFDSEFIIDHFKPCGENFEGFTDNNPMLMLSGVKATNKAVEEAYDTYTYKKLQLEENRKLMEEKEAESDLDLDLERTKKPLIQTSTSYEEVATIDDILSGGESFWDDIMNM